jgi:ribosome-binding factor A
MKNRLARVCEVIKRELSAAIAREIQFPVPLVTISSVDITPDLKQAHVFISAIGESSARARVLELLTEARVSLQGELARRVIIKHTPHLRFHLDDSIERGTRVLAIMDELGLEIGPSSLPQIPPPPES